MGFLSSRQRMGIAAIILAASAFLSRLMGLIRDKIISWQFGASGEADMYFAAFVVPDIINYLLAGGFMSITIIPLLAKGFQENPDEAWRFFSCVLCWMLLGSILLTTFGELLAGSLAAIVAPGFSQEQCQRLAFFMRIILPAQIFFLSGAPFTALLLLRRQFAVPALAPLIYNGFIITSGLLFPLFFRNAANIGMTGYCIGVSLGAFAGALILPLCVAIREKPRIRLIFRHPWLKKFLIMALPLMLGQTVVMLDEQFLRVFGSMLGEGGVSLLNYGRRIAQVPIALMGQAMSVASYPFLVKLLAENDLARFDQTLNRALGLALGLLIPCVLWMITAAVPILSVIFEGGRFGASETLACAPLTQIMLAAAPVWIIYMLLARAFYAYEDTLTPAITGTAITLGCIPLYYLCARHFGAWGIAAISGVGVTAYVAWLGIIWIRRHGNAAFSGLGKICARILVCSLPAALASGALLKYGPTRFFASTPILKALCEATISGLVFACAFLFLLRFLAPDIWLLAKGRIWRKRH